MIRLAELTHTYRSLHHPNRPVRALDGISLHITPGTSLGLVGLNGAGKTTLLRLLLGYVRPTSGSVTIAGLPPRTYVKRNGIGYVPEDVAIPRRWTVEGALRAYALLSNVGEDGPARVESTLRRLGMEGLGGRRVAELSKGNLQRLAIAQALLCDRGLLVLDEPTDGLDPVWIAELRSIIAEWRARDSGRTVIIASHNLPQIERIADRVIILHAGRVLADLRPGEKPSALTLEDEFLRLMEQRAGAA